MSSRSAYHILKRTLDVVTVVMLAPVILPLALVVAAIVRITSKGPSLHWSRRIGAYEKIFEMPKFRTMRVGTPQLATHLLPDAASVLTPVGGFLRRSSLDELPQLWCVLRGEMTLVGPRPALFNQDDLIALRRASGVAPLRPGLTGLAQVMGRDELSIPEKVAYDARYLDESSFWMDLSILLRTVANVVIGKGVRH